MGWSAFSVSKICLEAVSTAAALALSLLALLYRNDTEVHMYIQNYTFPLNGVAPEPFLCGTLNMDE